MHTLRSIPRSGRAVALPLARAVVGLSTPAVARTVVDFAKRPKVLPAARLPDLCRGRLYVQSFLKAVVFGMAPDGC